MSLRTLIGLGITIALAAPATADEPKKVSVTCDVVEVWATHGKGVADPALAKQLVKRFEQTLKQNEFKQLSSNKVTLETKKSQTLKLAKGSGAITLIETVNKSQARLTVAFSAVKGKSTATQLVAGGDWVVASVNQSNDAKAEAHVLAVGSCK